MRSFARMAMLAMVAWASLTAAAPSLPVMPGYKRTSFTIEQGAPGSVTSIAQTADGFLWIGTAQGLWRFDGVRFERMPALEKTGGSGVSALLATRGAICGSAMALPASPAAEAVAFSRLLRARRRRAGPRACRKRPTARFGQ